jgi:AcrR family transcriptional regulator
MSLSHIADRTETRILDGAYAQVMAVGFRRTTLTDVADRAGLSRMTVYRRFPDVTSVLQALMWREFGALLERSRNEAGDGADRRAQIVASAVRGLELLCDHELFLRLLDVDPELLLPYVTQRAGRFQDAVVDDLTAQLQEAMDAGAVRREDPARLARSMVLAMRGFAFASRDGSGRKQRRLALEDVARMLDGLLAP